jgi:hypothetical protein
MSVLHRRLTAGHGAFLPQFRCKLVTICQCLCRWAPFCSLYPDTDAAFGSLGSFFDFEACSGCYEVLCPLLLRLHLSHEFELRFQVNPPFISEIMLGVALRLEQLLDKSEVKRAGSVASGDGTCACSPALAFIVFVPGWTESPMWGKLQASAYLRACWSISSEGTRRMSCSVTSSGLTSIFRPWFL